MRTNHKGFTLLELLIVIAIIGIFAAITFAMLNSSRVNSRNAAVLSQMYEYQKSLELFYSDNGYYPGTNTGLPTTARTQRYCIGQGLSNYPAGYRCMGALTSAYSAAASAIPEAGFTTYLPNLIRYDQTRGTFDYSSPAYSGCIGTGVANVTPCATNHYSIWFLLETPNQDCGRAIVANANLSGEFTLCRLMPSGS